MIKYNNKLWFSHILSFHKTDTLRVMWLELIFVGIFSGAFVYIDSHYLNGNKAFDAFKNFQTIVSMAFSLLLVFRINSAYDRWWEGRKLWGSIVNNTRNLALKFKALVNEETSQDYFRRMITNYAYATKEHLREGVKLDELTYTELEFNSIKKEHVPNAIVGLMYNKLVELKKQNKLTDNELIFLDRDLKTYLDNLGGCERIKKTPIPYSYSIFLKKFIFIFVSSAPFAFIHILEYWTIVISMLIFYVFVSLELISEEIEDPFGTDLNDLPLDEICDTIKRNVDEIFDK